MSISRRKALFLTLQELLSSQSVPLILYRSKICALHKSLKNQLTCFLMKVLPFKEHGSRLL